MPTYKLTYFSVRGLAENIRLIFHQADVQFEDIRINFENRETEFPPIKQKCPMGQVPLLDVDGKLLAQSKAICRYLAKEFNLAGKTAWDQAIADMLVDGVEDCRRDMRPAFMAKLFEKNETKFEELWVTFKADALKKFMENYTKFLTNNKTGWLVGEEVTWADLVVADAVSTFASFEPGLLEQYPVMKQHHDKVYALPRIAAWIAKRPDTPF